MQILLSAKALLAYTTCMLLLASLAPAQAVLRSDPLRAVPFQDVAVKDPFFAPRIEVNRTSTVEAVWKQCEDTGRLRNFAVAAGEVEGKHQGFLFNDSDVYKLVEGIAYALHQKKALGGSDPALQERTQALIRTIAKAQMSDGYLNTYYQLAAPGERWKDIAHGHELYCAGHLIEAAIAWKAATGDTTLMDVAVKFAGHIAAEFGPGRRLDPPGHPELELALAKLHEATGEKRWLDLLRFFIGQRGSKQGRAGFGEYAQDHLPLREQKTIVGHAVRACYLYAGAADLARLDGDAGLLSGLGTIWDDLVGTKMYVTGGIGNSAANEGFTKSWDLPNKSSYCESCASIALAMWSQRMYLATGEARHAENVERQIYNNIPASVSMSGDRFFYVNPMETAGAARQPWFDCACCPTNIVRYLPAMGERVYATSGEGLDDTVWISQHFASSTTVVVKGVETKIEVRTDFPDTGRLEILVDPRENVAFTVKVRKPTWAKEVWWRVHPEHAPTQVQVAPDAADWIVMSREFKPKDSFQVHFLMPVRRETSDERVVGNRGRVALARGPQILCLEGVDAEGAARSVVLPDDARFEVAPERTLKNTRVAKSKGLLVERKDRQLATRPIPIKLVPYATWGNRGAGDMLVWLPTRPDLALPKGAGHMGQVAGHWVSASHCFQGDTVAGVLDGAPPKSSNDHDVPRTCFWPHKGGEAWVEVELPRKQSISKLRVYWFDDTGRGECRVPKSWRLLARQGEEWTSVQPAAGGFGVGVDAWQEVAFAPIECDGFKLEIAQQDGWSSGILELAYE
jgi:hypothetical protein